MYSITMLSFVLLGSVDFKLQIDFQKCSVSNHCNDLELWRCVADKVIWLYSAYNFPITFWTITINDHFNRTWLHFKILKRFLHWSHFTALWVCGSLMVWSGFRSSCNTLQWSGNLKKKCNLNSVAMNFPEKFIDICFYIYQFSKIFF